MMFRYLETMAKPPLVHVCPATLLSNALTVSRRAPRMCGSTRVPFFLIESSGVFFLANVFLVGFFFSLFPCGSLSLFGPCLCWLLLPPPPLVFGVLGARVLFVFFGARGS